VAAAGSDTLEHIDRVVGTKYARHPFAHGLTRGNARTVLRSYLAMSQAFPYLQAGAQKDLIFACIERNQDVPPDVEVTAVVGNFLCWDETGGHHLVLTEGVAGLPHVLDTRRRFHSNLLRRDLEGLLGEPVTPDYDPRTRAYLRQLHEGLACPDAVERCACMVAFERHAGQMIDALWHSVAQVFGCDKDRLSYFRVHVGGDDPAEPYHIALTARMIERLVAERRCDFLAAFDRHYGLSQAWCRDLIAE
jgi:hypothetical protein